MKINEVKVNSYGKLKNKELFFKDGINIVYGENEKGKSTLLNFISNMFYGTSKNKKGRNISDYERFKPWNNEEFSGKMKYTLDNNNEFEVFREFGKKNPKIYNEQFEDISKEFSIDKNTGNQFFYEQTKVDEKTFLSTVVSFQNEVEIDNQTQNVLLQKIANTSSTGDDSISYKKAIDKLNKKQLDEIGTARSQEKPINVINNEINRLKNVNEELKTYETYKYDLEDRQYELNNRVNSLKLKYDVIRNLDLIKQEENIEKSKLKFNENKIDEIENQIQNLINQKNILSTKKKYHQEIEMKKSDLFKYIAISAFFIILSIVICVLLRPVYAIASGVIAVIILIFAIVNNSKRNKINSALKRKNECILNENKEIERQVYQIDAQINLLEQNEKSQINETEQIKNEILKVINLKREKAISEYEAILGKSFIKRIINSDNLQFDLTNIQNEINDINIELHKLSMNKESIFLKLEELAQNEEKISFYEEQLRILEEKNDAINLAKELIENAYQKMKKSVTPKFTENLSKNIFEITDGKYNNVLINDENGIMVELPNGEYKEAFWLSRGTIEQLYLSFRISTLDSISKEHMPILFDEVFAYYDEKRLMNTIETIYKKYVVEGNRQIILFTCTNREESACNKLGIEYNKIIL